MLPVHAAADPKTVADFAAALVNQVSQIREDLDLLTDEVLARYEEVTLLHELSQDLGVVVDVRSAANAALARTFKAVRAQLGQVLVWAPDEDDAVEVACAGVAGQDLLLRRLASDTARTALTSGAEVMVHAGQTVPGSELVAGQPVLAVPLRLDGAGSRGSRAPGVLVLVGNAERQRFSAGEAQLAATVARQLAVGLENGRLIAALRDKERLEHELGIAAGIQGQLLSGDPPALPGARLRAVCLPAEHVGGDYYDFVVTDDGTLTAVVADVTGHGVGPALIMAMTRSVLRAEFRNAANLSDALAATNRTMWDDLLATGLFITVFCLAFEPQHMRVRYVNGGHHPALLRRPDGRVQELDSDGMPIGLLPDPGYEQGEARVEPGSLVLAFSDGVVENRGPDGKLFGTARLVEFLREHGDEPDFIDRLLVTLERHRAGAPQQDDITVVQLLVDEAPAQTPTPRSRT
ncbi:MAG: SpoIIE family protein phosphatase [Actinomycetota bacterium]|nr:SpoIIE family protein phosphatase [Actinomycetota bacterium]